MVCVDDDLVGVLQESEVCGQIAALTRCIGIPSTLQKDRQRPRCIFWQESLHRAALLLEEGAFEQEVFTIERCRDAALRDWADAGQVLVRSLTSCDEGVASKADEVQHQILRHTRVRLEVPGVKPRRNRIDAARSVGFEPRLHPYKNKSSYFSIVQNQARVHRSCHQRLEACPFGSLIGSVVGSDTTMTWDPPVIDLYVSLLVQRFHLALYLGSQMLMGLSVLGPRAVKPAQRVLRVAEDVNALKVCTIALGRATRP